MTRERQRVRLVGSQPASGGKANQTRQLARSGRSRFFFAVPEVVAARLRAVPLVVNDRGKDAEPFLRHDAWVDRPIVRHAAALVAPSGLSQQVFKRSGMPSAIVPKIAELARFSPMPAWAPQGALDMIVRNLEPVHDNATAIRALALLRDEVPEGRLTIAGEDSLRFSLERLAVERGVSDRVRFCGRNASDDMPTPHASADVSLSPSRVDNKPISLLESLASGGPVVSTECVGAPNLVEHQRAALLVDSGKPTARAQVVLRLLRDFSLDLWPCDSLQEDGRRIDWAGVRPRLLAVHAVTTNRGADVRPDVAWDADACGCC